jgi:hypothetical protein
LLIKAPCDHRCLQVNKTGLDLVYGTSLDESDAVTLNSSLPWASVDADRDFGSFFCLCCAVRQAPPHPPGALARSTRGGRNVGEPALHVQVCLPSIFYLLLLFGSPKFDLMSPCRFACSWKPAFLPTDRPAWSDRAGNGTRPRESVKLPDEQFWAWEEPAWVVDMGWAERSCSVLLSPLAAVLGSQRLLHPDFDCVFRLLLQRDQRPQGGQGRLGVRHWFPARLSPAQPVSVAMDWLMSNKLLPEPFNPFA